MANGIGWNAGARDGAPARPGVITQRLDLLIIPAFLPAAQVGLYALATSLGITGTPSYVIGNETVPGAVGKEAIETKVANIRACGKATC